MADVAALLKQREEIDQLIEKQNESAKADGVKRITDIMTHCGITLADLGGKVKAQPKKSTVAPKYRDPVTGSAWSGRGLQPRWMREAIAAGRTKQEFAL